MTDTINDDSKFLHYSAGVREWLLVVCLLCACSAFGKQNSGIDRKALVTRHNITIKDRNLKGPTQVGNGEFAFGFDITGLQTFSNNAVTMSYWGWHKFPLPAGQSPDDFKGQKWDTHGRMVRYDIQNPQQRELTNWMIKNPQRINLGRIGLVLTKTDGTAARLNDIRNPVQNLDLWTGIATSTFDLDGIHYTVTTIGNPNSDGIAVHITSSGALNGKLAVSIAFPYASLVEFGNGSDWNSPGKHSTKLYVKGNTASFHRVLDSTQYTVRLKWNGKGTIKKGEAHYYILTPDKDENGFSFVCNFDKKGTVATLDYFAQVKQMSINNWESFWKSGGAIDLSESKDQRWMELERRIVLSQYLMAVNEAGSLPPQESGLVNNGWNGKFHFEMYWWHGAHYALWDRWPLLNRSLHIYADNLDFYRKKAVEQGYKGVRWPKTIGDHDHWEWPCEITPLLIWQQPHPLFFAELDYRAHRNRKTLEKWETIVKATADFMATYSFYDRKNDRYVLGYPLQVVSENADPRTTINPTFELSYWRTGLKIAQNWRKRLGLPPDTLYDKVLQKLSPLPVRDSLYISWENMESMWTRYNFEHPALTGAYGWLPGDGVDTATMERTLKKVHDVWQLNRTWGWDFPMLAMCAARLEHGDQAISYLLDYPGFILDEHGLVDGGGPYPYFPGNGGLLYTVALMAAGWDGAPSQNAPGFPSDGSWVVKWEGLKPAL